MKVNNKETFRDGYLGADLGTRRALAVYDQIPKEANSSDNRKHLRFRQKLKPKIRERLLTFNAFDIKLKGSSKSLNVRKGTW